MCGLYASIGFVPDKARLDRVAHRGPDGEGWEVLETTAGQLTLGHRRLAIIDLDSRATQPMTSANGRYVVVFNGEIYNYIELREELLTSGQVFRTTSDCEVLLQAFQTWDTACLSKFRGMFAFIIYDKLTKRLIVARDAFGIKPLYYAHSQAGIAFGSEPKQLYDLDGISRLANRARLWDFLISQTSEHTDETMFQGIKSLRPGHLIEFDLTKPQLTQAIVQQRWFEVPKSGGINLDLGEAALRFEALLRRSIELHLRADVPVGSCLSGGLDSSSIVGIASQLRGRDDPISTFTAVFPGKLVDESKFAQDVVELNNAVSTFIEISNDDLAACVDDVIWHQDEPFGSTSILAQWFVFRAIGRSGIKVVLDGQGADEQLAGYHGLFSFHHDSLFRRGKYLQLISAILSRKFEAGIELRPLLTAVGRRMQRRFALPINKSNDSAQPDILSKGTLKDFAPKEGSTLNSILKNDGLPALETLGELCLAMTVSSNLPMLLRFEDRNSMAHSVEARVPFVDTDLIQFTLALGEHHKMVGSDNKKVLRQAMLNVLPVSVLARRDKLGFSTPESDWIRGGLQPIVKHGIALAKTRFPDLIDWTAADQLLNEAVVDGANAHPQVWRLANLGLWAERFDLH